MKILKISLKKLPITEIYCALWINIDSVEDSVSTEQSKLILHSMKFF